jgi:hypothetical protein
LRGLDFSGPDRRPDGRRLEQGQNQKSKTKSQGLKKRNQRLADKKRRIQRLADKKRRNKRLADKKRRNQRLKAENGGTKGWRTESSEIKGRRLKTEEPKAGGQKAQQSKAGGQKAQKPLADGRKPAAWGLRPASQDQKAAAPAGRPRKLKLRLAGSFRPEKGEIQEPVRFLQAGGNFQT